jgi:hypothetical protein
MRKENEDSVKLTRTTVRELLAAISRSHPLCVQGHEWPWNLNICPSCDPRDTDTAHEAPKA